MMMNGGVVGGNETDRTRQKVDAHFTMCACVKSLILRLYKIHIKHIRADGVKPAFVSELWVEFSFMYCLSISITRSLARSVVSKKFKRK